MKEKRLPLPQTHEFQVEWWKIRMLLKPKIRNGSTEMSHKTWKHIKRALKQELLRNGFSSALEMAQKYLPKD
jgi:hypothetical protein